MDIELPTRYDRLNQTTRKVVREKYIQMQKNKCWYCQHDLDGKPPKTVLDKPITLTLFPRGFLNYPIHLQHDHNTGLTEGAVHAYCNAVLWEHYGR